MKKIAGGVYADGDYLPVAAVLAGKYQVAEITIRSAVALLTKIGMAQTINGNGTRPCTPIC